MLWDISTFATEYKTLGDDGDDDDDNKEFLNTSLFVIFYYITISLLSHNLMRGYYTQLYTFRWICYLEKPLTIYSVKFFIFHLFVILERRWKLMYPKIKGENSAGCVSSFRTTFSEIIFLIKMKADENMNHHLLLLTWRKSRTTDFKKPHQTSLPETGDI